MSGAGARNLRYEEVDPQFLVSLLGREVNESDLSVFQSAYRAGGYAISDDLVEQHYETYMRTQEVPAQVARYCRRVLLGQIAYLGATACYLLA